LFKVPYILREIQDILMECLCRRQIPPYNTYVSKIIVHKWLYSYELDEISTLVHQTIMIFRAYYAHNSLTTNHSFATRVSQLKICDFSGETVKGFEVL